MLAVEIEYLNGVSFASSVEDRKEHEWPPHPDRVFLALVASWGEAGKNNTEADALRWLESQNPPDVIFPNVHKRTRFTSFVPTSSNKVGGVMEYLDVRAPIHEMKSAINRKPRDFPACILPSDCNKVHVVWQNTVAPPEYNKALSNLAMRVSRMGHSASLVRVATITELDHECDNRWVRDGNGDKFLRCPQKERFDMLRGEYERGGGDWRPSISRGYRYREFVPNDIKNNMGGDWTILSLKSGSELPLERFPIVAKKMRDAIMSHIQDPVHRIVSGHNPDGTALQEPHLAIIPMANVGWGKYSDGRVLGISLILPSRSGYGTEERKQLKQAIAKFLNAPTTSRSESDKIGTGTLKFGERMKLKLERHEDDRRSLQAGRYTGKSKEWDTVTPIVLDKHPKKNKSAEAIIGESCVRVGLPSPKRVEISRYSSVPGAPTSFIGKDAHKGWQPPKRGMLDGRFVCHATLKFDEYVYGPLILGSGRYYGMGLCIKDGVKSSWV